MTAPVVLLLAALLDAAMGEPDALWRRVPHPAVMMGRLVTATDRLLNRGPARRVLGAVAIMALALGAAAFGVGVARLPDGGVLEILVAAVLLAHRSLCDHVQAVAQALRGDVAAGRASVGRIVGRDTADLDPPGIARAAIESAAENLSDGVIAPAFWFLVGGLPAMLAYKMVNTADSMIGYRTPRHEAFGWGAARLDDVLNWAPARLTAALILLATRTRPDIDALRHDAGLHRSPNAGWPEAAMAQSMNVALSGPRSYHGARKVYDWVWPSGDRAPGPGAISGAVTVLWKVWGLGLGVLVLLGLVF